MNFDQLWSNLPLHGVLPTSLSSSEQKLTKTDDRLTSLYIWQKQSRAACVSEPIWKKIESGKRYTSQLKLYRLSNGLLLKINCEGNGEFEYTPKGIGIYWENEGTGPSHYFQGTGLSLWLELRGIPCIHANCLAMGDKAFGIIAPSQTGKTTLTAALLESGLQVMTDDMLALHQRSDGWIAYPGWPQLRMWPDVASQYTNSCTEKLDKVHHRFDKLVLNLTKSEKFKVCKIHKPLRQLFLLERMNEISDEVYIQDITPRDALIHLLQNSILGDAYQALGIEQARVKRLAALLSRITLKKIQYSSGFEYLPKVCARIHAELKME
jgi:hypothetical protein